MLNKQLDLVNKTTKKLFEFIHNMITEGNLAAAQIAQLFGSELLKVQRNAQTDSGAVPNIVNLDPKQFLINQQITSNQRRADEQRMIQALQKEAEAAYPLAEPQLPPPEPVSEPAVRSPKLESLQSKMHRSTSFEASASTSVDVWASIACSLERIANTLERVDISVKKKRIKRATK